MSKHDLQTIETLYFECAKCVLHTERLLKEHYRAHYLDTHTEFAMQILALLP